MKYKSNEINKLVNNAINRRSRHSKATTLILNTKIQKLNFLTKAHYSNGTIDLTLKTVKYNQDTSTVVELLLISFPIKSKVL